LAQISGKNPTFPQRNPTFPTKICFFLSAKNSDDLFLVINSEFLIIHPDFSNVDPFSAQNLLLISYFKPKAT